MMKRLLSLLHLLLLLTLLNVQQAAAQTRVWNRPATIYEVQDGTELTRVELSDTATLVSFRRTTPWYNDTLRVHSTSFIIDEEGHRHFSLASYGIRTDEYLRWGQRDEWEYTLKFDPLPRRTRCIDVVGGPYDGSPEWYGVHDASTALRLPAADTRVSQKALRQELMKRGTATVRGHVTNGKDYPVWPIWVLRATDELTGNVSGPQTADNPPMGMPVLIRENGDFEFSVELERPLFAYLYLGYHSELRPIMLYLEPGKTVTLDVRDVYGHGAFLGYSANQRFRRLLEAFPVRLRRGFPEAYVLRFQGETTRFKTEELLDYLAYKYKLSPMENRLLWAMWQVSVLDARLARCGMEKDTWKARCEVLSSMGEDDVSLLFSPYYYNLVNEIWPSSSRMDTPRTGRTYYKHSDPEGQLRYFMETSVPKKISSSLSGFRQTLLGQVGSLLSMSGEFETWCPDDWEGTMSYLDSCYTDPYVRSRVRGLMERSNAEYKWNILPETQPRVTDLSGHYGYDVLQRLAAPHKGKYVQVISLRQGGNDRVVPTIGNLLLRYADSPDIDFLFVARESAGSDEDCVNQILNYYPFGSESKGLSFLRNGYARLSETDYNVLVTLLGGVTGDFDYVTLDRQGRLLVETLSLQNEVDFTMDLKTLLADSDQPVVTEPTVMHNGVEIQQCDLDGLSALHYSLNGGSNLRPLLFVEDYNTPLLPEKDANTFKEMINLTAYNDSLPFGFDITKHLQLPSTGTYRVDFFYTLGDNRESQRLSGDINGEPFTLNPSENERALGAITMERAKDIPLLSPIANEENWLRFYEISRLVGLNYATFTIHNDKGRTTVDCTLRQAPAAEGSRGSNVKSLYIIDLRATKVSD